MRINYSRFAAIVVAILSINVVAGHAAPRESESLSLSLSGEISGVFLDEPLSESNLNRIEKALQKSKHHYDQAVLSAILYRYRRDSGTRKLRQLLREKKNLLAATVLTAERSPSDIDFIFKALTKDQFADRDLLLALGKWRHPKVAKGLIEYCKLQAGQPFEGPLSLALAKQKLHQFLPQITRTFQKSAAAPMAYGWGDIGVAVALHSFKAANHDKILLPLQRMLETGTTQPPYSRLLTAPLNLIESLVYLGDPESEKMLVALIQNYLRKPDSKFKVDVKTGNVPMETMVTIATEGLSKTNKARNYSLMTELFLKLSKQVEEYKHYPGFAPHGVVAVSMLNMNPSGNHALIKKIMGEKWLAKEMAKRRLKPVPPECLSVEPKLYDSLRLTP